MDLTPRGRIAVVHGARIPLHGARIPLYGARIPLHGVVPLYGAG